MSISSTVVHRADIRFHEPAEALRSFVGCFWVVSAEPGATIRVVPDGSTAISIELGTHRPSGWLLRGPLIRPDERRFSGKTTLAGIRLRPGVAFLLSGTPTDTIVGRRIRLAGQAAFQNLVSQPQPEGPDACIGVLQRYLLRRLEQASVSNTVATALREIEQAHGCIRVTELASRCGVSVRHLHRLLRLWVGFGPKSYANIVRFQATLHEMDDVPGRAAASLASGNGYFDQAHLALDVARFAGATPARLANGAADFSKTRCDDLP